MALPAEWLTSYFLLFAMVLARVGGLVATSRFYGASVIPVHIRAVLAVAIAAMILPTQSFATSMPMSLVQLAIWGAAEATIGATLGLGVSLLFSGVQLAGQLIAQTSGLSLAEVVNPDLDGDTSLFSQALFMFALAIYVLIGGHRLLMAGLLDSFVALPPGDAGFSRGIVDALSSLASESFALGLCAAAPATIAVLLASLVLGFVSRTLPQVNTLSLGFGLQSICLFLALAASVGVIAWLFADQVEPAIDFLVEAVTSTDSSLTVAPADAK
jgi:flagellar biosynthetic protein FliR